MKLLLANKADPNIQTTDKTTALMALSGVGYADGFTRDFGSEADSLEAMKILIDLGADENAVNADGVTAAARRSAQELPQGHRIPRVQGRLISPSGSECWQKPQYERKGRPRHHRARLGKSGIRIGRAVGNLSRRSALP